ncbi:MAG: DnaD domain protein [Clostridiales bacterium]|nr:DnaD domain protein [Clostridiales bacterium]
MAFCSFSKDSDGNSFVAVENKFITKYLPEADGFAVKVYLYGLYLCKNPSVDFTLASMAEVLKTSEEKIVSAFAFWEDYDLVEILSKSPFAVQYLPVKSAIGRPKKVRYEQYGDFNKELQRKLQTVGKFVSAGDYLKYMRFLEENPMQPQALLLIVEYCINKQGENISPSYIFNKAKKLLKNGCSTFEQVEKELSNFNAHESDLTQVLGALGGYQKQPDESDYSLYRKWTETLGFNKDAVITVAKRTKRGSITSLDFALEELYEKGKLDADEIEAYLSERETLANLTFRIGRKLGAKVSNPATFIDEYVEKWFACGYEDTSLLDIALYCLKTDRGNFDSMNTIVDKLFAMGIVAKEDVKAFLKERTDELKLFEKIREICPSVRKSSVNVSMIRTWKDWAFSDEMILEASKRSVSSANAIPYMNKILADWKKDNVFSVQDIPQDGSVSAVNSTAKTFVSPTVEAVNAKADRERYYALLREKAIAKADKFLAKANENARFKQITAELAGMEISIAKAEVFESEKLPALLEKKKALAIERKAILDKMGIDESDLLPQFVCKKCKDTGFLESGKACDCYKK